MKPLNPTISLCLSIPLALTLASCGAGQPKTMAAPAPERSAGADYAASEAAPDSAADYDYDESSDAPAAEEAEPMADMAGEVGASAPSGAPAPRPATRVATSERRTTVARPDRPAVVARSGVKAGEWDDNANYREYQKYLETQGHFPFVRVNVSDRQFLVVRDSRGKAVPGCQVEVFDNSQNSVRLTTMSSGRAILFPHAEGLQGQDLTATASCLGTRQSQKFSLAQSGGRIAFKLSKSQRANQKRTIDIVFVLDSTGSMSEEIAAVKSTIHSVAATLKELGVSARVGLVEYKDRSDRFVTRIYPMTSNFNQFSRDVASISAAGGGDTPEHVNEGLRVALDDLAWNQNASARLAFLIGDARPQLNYQQDVSYTESMRTASHRGIQLFTIAASGMDGLGQVIWRQIAQYTGGTNMFVLRGGAGPQSTGGGDPKSSCGGTHKNFASGNLDALISGKIRQSLAVMDVDPMRIPGLDRDEKAKPCNERIVIMAQ